MNWFPLTKFFYHKGIKRWNEPYNHDETVGYCGPDDRPCIDCYLCFTPACFVLDISSLCSFQCKRFITTEPVEVYNIDDETGNTHFRVSEV